jgi:hypothetical protein
VRVVVPEKLGKKEKELIGELEKAGSGGIRAHLE